MYVEMNEEILKRIDQVYFKINFDGYDYTKRQVLNMARELCHYDINDVDDFMYALEYACKMRQDLLFTIKHVIGDDNPKYYPYKTLNYAAERAISTLNGFDDKRYKIVKSRRLEETASNMMDEMWMAREIDNVQKRRP